MFPRSFVKSARLFECLGYFRALQMALGSYIQTADQTRREEFNSGFRHLDLVNDCLVDTVKGSLIILKQTPTFAPLNSFLPAFASTRSPLTIIGA